MSEIFHFKFYRIDNNITYFVSTSYSFNVWFQPIGHIYSIKKCLFPSLFLLDGKKNVEIKKNDASSQLVKFSKNKHSEQHDYFLSF